MVNQALENWVSTDMKSVYKSSFSVFTVHCMVIKPSLIFLLLDMKKLKLENLSLVNKHFSSTISLDIVNFGNS